MASIDFTKSLREQLYVLPETKEITKKEKDIILEFKRLQYAVFFKEEIYQKSTKFGATGRDIERVISKGKQKNLTFEEGITNLYNLSINRKLSDKLVRRIDNARKSITESSIADCHIMLGTCYKGMSEKEMQLATLCVYVEVSFSTDLRPLSEVSDMIGVASDTIRQACQDGRIIARKFNNGWTVSLDECREYWTKDEK